MVIDGKHSQWWCRLLIYIFLHIRNSYLEGSRCTSTSATFVCRDLSATSEETEPSSSEQREKMHNEDKKSHGAVFLFSQHQFLHNRRERHAVNHPQQRTKNRLSKVVCSELVNQDAVRLERHYTRGQNKQLIFLMNLEICRNLLPNRQEKHARKGPWFKH